jgi:AraC family transcriptional regulator
MKARILWDARTRSGWALRLVAYAPGTRQLPHAHDRDSVTLVLCGDLVEGSERGEERAAALSVVAKPAGVEHENLFGPAGARTLQIELPRSRRRFAGTTIPGAHPRWEHAGPACRALLRLLSRVDLAAPGAADVATEELVRGALAGLAPTSARDAPPPPWLVEARSSIERESTPLATLARRAGVHPVYLARRFRAQFGVSPAAYRARLRVQRAARLLEAGGPLATVALDAGYYDQPHMNRQVRATTGLTPRALRRISIQVSAPAARGVE